MSACSTWVSGELALGWSLRSLFQNREREDRETVLVGLVVGTSLTMIMCARPRLLSAAPGPGPAQQPPLRAPHRPLTAWSQLTAILEASYFRETLTKLCASIFQLYESNAKFLQVYGDIQRNIFALGFIEKSGKQWTFIPRNMASVGCGPRRT